ncbi:MAG: hypothetical protein DWQ37_01955 [Planctomycetota bacterium]|nr:MAG: hypothetical protein DWQ37_01955 [Planctomycetota bacterium]
MDRIASAQPLFRLWIASYANWEPQRWNEAPPEAVALEPVADTAYTEREATVFLEGFNTAMLSGDRPLWAVAVPVALRYEGDVQAGAVVRGHVFADQATASPA